jgi:hypothetical protein
VEEDIGRDEFVKMIRADEDFCGVEVLTYFVMSNYFYMLVQLPHRPAEFDLPLEFLAARLERAVGSDGGG